MRRMIRMMCAAFAAFVLAMATSCERRPLLDLSNTHYVRVYIDEELLNVTKGFYNEEYARPTYDSPDVLRVVLADPQTGLAKAERFLRDMGKDEKGTFYEGYIIADPGRYKLMAYNFDTESTIVGEANSHNDAKAYTNEIASHLKTKIPSRAGKKEQKPAETKSPEKIVYDPDHLFAASCGDVYIPYAEQLDTLRTPEGEHFTASSLVKSYYLQVRVKGLQYATSSVGLMTGLAGSAWINGAGMDEDDPVTVYFEMMPGESNAAGVMRTGGNDVATIYTTFSTFGKLPDAENELEITFDFLTTYGKPYSETIDVTELFSTPEAVEHQWLLIDHVIEIPEPPEGETAGGGFTPSVDEWGDVETDIII